MRSRTLHGQNTLQFRATSELLRDCDLLETSLSFSRPPAPRPFPHYHPPPPHPPTSVVVSVDRSRAVTLLKFFLVYMWIIATLSLCP